MDYRPDYVTFEASTLSYDPIALYAVRDGVNEEKIPIWWSVQGCSCGGNGVEVIPY